MIKLMLVYGLIVFGIPTMAVFLIGKIMEWNKKNMKEIKAVRQEQFNNDLNRIYKTETEKFYLECRELFKGLMKEGKLKRDDVKGLKNMINNCLGDCVKHYKGFAWKNDAHEIYTKLKCRYIDKGDFQLIKEYLLKFKN